LGGLLRHFAFQNDTAISLDALALPVPAATPGLKTGITLQQPAATWQGHHLLIEGQIKTLTADLQTSDGSLEGQRRTDAIGVEINGRLLPLEPGLALRYRQPHWGLQHQPPFERVARQAPGLQRAGCPLGVGIGGDHRTAGFKTSIAW
jgi:hypothetical protein